MRVFRRRWGRVAAALTLVLLIATGPTLAQQATPAHQSFHGGGNQEPVNLDLSSTAATIAAPGRVSQMPVNIQAGGASQPVVSGQMLTAAQFVAVQQILRNGTQNILLGANGAAVGGSMVIGQRLSQNISALVIPKGVTVVDRAAMINLAGNLNNSGSLFVVSSKATVTTATIAAMNIMNQQGALLSSVFPAGGLPGVTSAVSALNLNLTAVQNIINAGVISSSGNLSMTAGGSIVNALPAGAVGASPIMQALNNVNLNSSNIVNSGMIAASTGNINIASQMAQATAAQAAQNLNINNAGGTLSALNGSINVRDALYSGTGKTDVTGGRLMAKEANFYAGNGSVDVNVDSIQGVFNTAGNEAHVAVAGGNLTLGNLLITGDPTFINATSGIEITGLVTAGDSLAILADGDITASGTGHIALNSSGTIPFNLLMVAGAQITPNGNTDSSALPGGTPTTTDISVDFSAGNGGSINLTGSSFAGPVIDTAGTFTGDPSAGGSVVLAARAGGSGGGQIILPSNAISTTGQSGGANGNVTLIAGASSGTSINVGSISTSNGNAGSGGTVTIATSQPTGNGGSTISVKPDGTIASGALIVRSANIEQAGISLQSITTNGASVSVLAGGDITTNGQSIDTSQSELAGNGGNVSLTATGASSTLSFNSITSNGFDTGDGGTITLSVGGNLTIDGSLPSISARSGNNGGNGGSFLGIAGGSVTLNSLSSINLSPLGANGNGGNLTLVAGKLTAADLIINTSIDTAGSGSGVGGKVSLQSVSGQVLINNTITTHGSAVIALAATDVLIGAAIDTTGAPDGTTGSVLVAAGAATTPTNGNITIGANVSSSSTMTFLASGNITATSGLSLLQARSGDLQGHNIQLIAGGNLSTGPTPLPSAQTVTLDGAASSGGTINLDAASGGGASDLIDASGYCPTCNGGNVLFAAYRGTSAGGTISINTSVQFRFIEAVPCYPCFGSFATGNAGNITVLAGGSSGTTILTDNKLTFYGGSANGHIFNNGSGSILITTSQPTSSDGQAIVFDATGAIPLGNHITKSNTVENASIVMGGFFGFGSATVDAGNSVTLSLAGSAQSTDPGDGGDITITARSGSIDGLAFVTVGRGTGKHAGRILLTAAHDITLNTSFAQAQSGASGGILTLIAGGDIQILNALQVNPSAAGDAGRLLVVAGADFSLSGTSVNIGGQSVSGGKIIVGGQIAAFAGTGGNGGDVQFVAFEGSAPTGPSGGISLNATASNTNMSGVNSGSGGSLLVIAGEDDGGQAIIFGSTGTINTKSGASGGTPGSVTLAAATPKLVGGSVVISRTTGLITFGSFAPDTNLVQNGDISTQAIITGGGNVTVTTAGNITTSSLAINADRFGSAGKGGDVTLTASGVSSTISFGSITANGFDTGDGGSVTLSVGGSFTIDSSLPTITARSGLNGGNGGLFTAIAGGALTWVTGSSINISPQFADGNGGSVTLIAGNSSVANLDVQEIIDTEVFGTGKGGNAFLQSKTGNVTLAGLLTQGGDLTVLAAGSITADVGVSSRNVTGDSGAITLIAQGGGINLANSGFGAANAASVIGAGGNILIAAAGSVNMTALVSHGGIGAHGGSINVVSGGDISVAASVGTSVSSGGFDSNSGNIMLVAGANFTYTGTTVTIDSQSSSGGSITTLQAINTSPTVTGPAAAAAGNITLVAYEGTTGSTSSGQITVTAPVISAINATGRNGGSSGLVTILAGDDDNATSISVSGRIRNLGPPADVTIGTTTPKVAGGLPVTITKATGTVDKTFTLDNAHVQSPGVSLRAIESNGGNITITTGGVLGLTGAINSGASAAGGKGGDITLTAGTFNINGVIVSIGGSGADGVGPGQAGQTGGDGGAITMTATAGSIIISTQVFSHGGNGGQGASGSPAGVGGTGGAGGTITLNSQSGTFIELNAAVSSIGGTGGQGGTGTGSRIGGAGGAGGPSLGVIIQAGTDLTVNTTPSSTGGTGGQGGTGADSDFIAFDGGTGGAAGSAGSITLSAGNSINVTVPWNLSGGQGGKGGTGGFGTVLGGDGGAGGNGGVPAALSLATTNGSITTRNLTSVRGPGGDGGDGGSGLTIDGLDGLPGGSGTSSNSISLNSGGAINTLQVSTEGTDISMIATGTLTTNGQTISANSDTPSVAAGTITISGTSVFNLGAISSSGLNNNNNGGIISVINSANTVFNAPPISANGVINGGSILIRSRGLIQINNSVVIQANGTSAGGHIAFKSFSPLVVVNNGTISATGAGGRIGFNGGTDSVTLVGSGSVQASEFVSFGNLNDSTLDLVGPGFTVPAANVFGGGNIFAQQGTPIGAVIKASFPPNPVVPGFGGSAATAGTTTPVLVIIATNSSNGQNRLDVILGSRIATDFTPFGTLPEDSATLLQGYVSSDSIVGAISGLVDLNQSSVFLQNSFDALVSNPGNLNLGSGSGGNFLNLQKGSVIICPTSAMSIQTKEGLVTLAPGSFAIVIETGNDVSIYNLHDRRSGDVKVAVGKTLVTVPPGKQLVLTKAKDKNFEDLNPNRKIAYRNPKAVDLGEVKGFLADFSMPSALMAVKPLKEMMTSPSAAHRKVIYSMLKNAVILADLNAAMGVFKASQNP